MTQLEELLTTADVARITRAPESTVRYWRHIVSGPTSFRVGRRVVYQRSDVETWLAAQRVTEGLSRAAS
jgi:predicted DNA-binding transcriptional regulator AlpA